MDEVKKYILAKREIGANDLSIAAELKAAGWENNLVEQAFSELGDHAKPLPTPEAVSQTQHFDANAIFNKFGPTGSLGAQTQTPAVVTSSEAIPEKPKHSNKLKYVAVLAIVAVLGLAAFQAYSYFMNQPAKIWADVLGNITELESARFKIDATYTDKAPENTDSDTGSDFFGLDFGGTEVSLSASGNGGLIYYSDKKDIDYDATSNLNVKFGSFSLGFGFDSRKIGDNIYYKTEGNPLAAFLGGSSYGDSPSGSGSQKKASWIKMSATEESLPSSNITDTQQTQLAEAIKKVKVMKPVKLLGTEKIGDVNTLHYQAQLDKAELIKFFQMADESLSLDDSKSAETFLNKLEFKRLEMWVGKFDHQLYQVVIETNAPSYMSAVTELEEDYDYGSNGIAAKPKQNVFENIDFSANFKLQLNLSDYNSKIEIVEPTDFVDVGDPKAESRDQRRLSDVRQLMTANEIFYNDNGRYPKSLNGQPIPTDGTTKYSEYMRTYPVPPTPPDGQCTTDNNKYWYEQVSGGKDYKLTFCLGQETGGFQAGELIASSSGISAK